MWNVYYSFVINNYKTYYESIVICACYMYLYFNILTFILNLI